MGKESNIVHGSRHLRAARPAATSPALLLSRSSRHRSSLLVCFASFLAFPYICAPLALLLLFLVRSHLPCSVSIRGTTYAVRSWLARANSALGSLRYLSLPPCATRLTPWSFQPRKHIGNTKGFQKIAEDGACRFTCRWRRRGVPA